MVYKLAHLSVTKEKVQLRLYLPNLIAHVAEWNYYDNPSVPNRFPMDNVKVRSKKKKRGQQANAEKRVQKFITEYIRKMEEQMLLKMPPPSVGQADPAAFYPIS